ncbi:MAG: glycosyltransferase [Gemmatimonadota bacterium]
MMERTIETEPETSLAVLHVLTPGPAGGLESVVRALAGGLARRGHRVGIAAVVDRGADQGESLVNRTGSNGPDLRGEELPPRAYVRERAFARREMLRFRPDVVHTHGYRADVLAGGAARRLGIPTVSTQHGFTGGDWKNRLYQRLQIRAIRRASAVVVVSRPLGTTLAARGVLESRIHLIRNAFDASARVLEREAARRFLGLSFDDFVVGWVGRLSPEKDPALLLEAVRRLHDLPDLVASILGGGVDRRALEAGVAGPELAGRVRLHGIVPGAARLYRAFDAFVLSSRTEGTPIALFEAMAAGVPIVATRVGGVPDVVTDREALLVPPRDPDALAEALRALHADRGAARERAAAARRRLEEEFGIAPWLAAHERLYRAVASSRSGTGP